jgi:hypothetical protein
MGSLGGVGSGRMLGRVLPGELRWSMAILSVFESYYGNPSIRDSNAFY